MYTCPKIENETLLALVIESFILDAHIPFNFDAKPITMLLEIRKASDKRDAIYRILNLEGIVDEQGEFLLMPDNLQLEYAIRQRSDVYNH